MVALLAKGPIGVGSVEEVPVVRPIRGGLLSDGYIVNSSSAEREKWLVLD